jgi:four helix bundle protein
MSKGFKDLKVYQTAYDLSMEIYQISKSFPKEETYSLTDQIRRASRSVCANIAEAYRKRRYPKLFLLTITNADSEASEALVWIDYARDCGYISKKTHESLSNRYGEVGKMFGSIISHPERFIIK